MPLGPGSRLDAYELVSPLGRGGMGEVWLATETKLGRKVALKLLPAELTQDAARVRFEQEALIGVHRIGPTRSTRSASRPLATSRVRSPRQSSIPSRMRRSARTNTTLTMSASSRTSTHSTSARLPMSPSPNRNRARGGDPRRASA